MKKTLLIIVGSFIIFSSLVVWVELLCQVGYLVKNGSLLPLQPTPVHSRLLEIHPYLAGRLRSSVPVTEDNKTITTTNLHTRWTGAPSQDEGLIRVAILGGSTAFGTGVTDRDSWPAILQDKLGGQYAVFNYAVPGYSTAEHIVQMALLVPEKRPHFVVFYEGWNDIRNYHEEDLGVDYYGHGIRQFTNLGIPVYQQHDRFRGLTQVFATAWVVDRLKSKLMNRRAGEIALYDTPDSLVDRLYVRNLNTLKLLAGQIGAFPIFVPQLLDNSSFQDEWASQDWTRHIRDNAMTGLMARFNGLLSEVCAKEDTTCFVFDEVLAETWTQADFIAEGHFSRRGGMNLADMIARLIRRKSAERSPPKPR